jgi:uncharacterized protein (TIGR03435 family)
MSVNASAMSLRIGIACFAFALAPRIHAQSARAEFDVASIRVLQDRKVNLTRFDPAGITFTGVSLIDCIVAAYDVKDFQISIKPGPYTNERYKITAKSAGPETERQLKSMLQTLLADRFKLILHREHRELSVYALVVGKNGPKLHVPEGGAPSGMKLAGNGLAFKGTSMPEFGAFLARLEPIGLPVLDRTGLTGSFDFNLTLPDIPPSPDEIKKQIVTWPSIFTDVQEQLGLKLDSQKAPIEMLVVEHAETPSEN